MPPSAPEPQEAPPAERRAVVLLSGGLDSATVLAIARQQGFSPYALSVAYGQRQSIELDASLRVAEALGAAEHRTIAIELDSFGGSALTSAIEVPKGRSAEQMEQGVPITYVPARNTVLLSCALAWAEVLGAFDIFVGVNAVDYSGYPDCRPAFIDAFEKLANVATTVGTEAGGRFRIHAPLMKMSKAEIIQLGTKLGVDYAMTHSCYDPSGELACGQCDACQLRRQGFSAAQMPDPTAYAPQPPEKCQ